METNPPLDPEKTEPKRPLDTHLRNRITRYIHTGMELPKYYPGCWTSHKYFEANKLKAINEAFDQNFDITEVIDIIVKAYKDGLYTRYETIAFALTLCLKLDDQAVKEAAYRAVAEVCNTPEQLMLFTKYTRLFKTGNGHGWCKSVGNWYKSKDPMELAQEVTRVKARHGRSHKILIKKSHLKVDESDYARDAVVKYAIFGLKRAKELMGDKEGTKEIFDYIKKVDDLRVCEEESAAAVMAEKHKFTLDHVPGQYLASQALWNAVLPQFSLEEVVRNIQRIHNMGFFNDDSITTSIVLSLLSNKELIQKSQITPLEIYITLCNYQKMSRPIKMEKAKFAVQKEKRRRARQTYDCKTGLWEWNTTRRHPKELKHLGIDYPPNQAILSALNKLIDDTWLLSPATGASYLITLDMRHHMFKGRHFCKALESAKKGKASTNGNATENPTTGGGDADNVEKKCKKHPFAECFYHKTVTPGHAAIVMALQFLKREKNAKLAVFTDSGIQMIPIDAKVSRIEEAEFILRKAPLGCVQLDAPIQWATLNKAKVDVFINMVDRTTRYMELDLKARGGRGPGGRFGPPPPPGSELIDHCPVRALEKYRATRKQPDAKLIVMSLASHRVETTDGSHEGVLDIVGIDEHVPKVIDAFVLGQFK